MPYVHSDGDKSWDKIQFNSILFTCKLTKYKVSKSREKHICKQKTKQENVNNNNNNNNYVKTNRSEKLNMYTYKFNSIQFNSHLFAC
jgi:hypothetical protein